jgi:hypothetical protein
VRIQAEMRWKEDDESVVMVDVELEIETAGEYDFDEWCLDYQPEPELGMETKVCRTK